MSSTDRENARKIDLDAATSPHLDSGAAHAPAQHPLQLLAARVGVTSAMLQRKILQRRAQRDGAAAEADSHAIATEGLQGAASALPHLEQIQSSFGGHDVSGVEAYVGGAASHASAALGASAYATGNSVAFAAAPDLHTAAHEAAHVVQQRAGVHLSGGLGQEGDAYEQHADRVADAVVAGQSAEPLLDQHQPQSASADGSATQRRALFAPGEAVQLKWSQTVTAVQDSHHNGVKSQYTSGTNIVELHIDAGANTGGTMMQDFLMALWEARDAITEGQTRAPGGLFMRPGGAQVLKMTMELLGEAFGQGQDLQEARELQEDRKKAKVPMTGDNDTLDATILPEHKAYRDSMVGAQGVTISPIGGGTSGGTVNMLDPQLGAAERNLYDQAIFGLKPLLALAVTVDLAGLNTIITMMEGRMKLFEKLALKLKYKTMG